MPEAKPVLFKLGTHYELGTVVYKPGIGFNSPDQYGIVIGYDFLGSGVVDWSVN